MGRSLRPDPDSVIVELRVRDLATIADVTLEFGDGLNVLSGETGAGKSMLVDALALLLGDQLVPDLDLLFFVTDQIAATGAQLALAVLRVAADVVALVSACDVHRGVLLSRDPRQPVAGVVR